MDIDDPILVALITTPAMKDRITALTKEIVEMIQTRTQTAAEAFILIHVVRRQLETKHNMLLMPPIREGELPN